jgi:predicted PurR-regulated permease PerM
MERFYIIMLSVLFSALLGMASYWIKTAHAEFKQLIKELTTYTGELKELIVGIQTQINKGIETDIKEIKEDIRTLYARSGKHESALSSINQKLEK